MFWPLAPPIWAVRGAFRPDSRPYLRAGSASGHSHAQERSGVEVTLGVYDFSRHPARIDRLETRMDAGPVFTTLIAQNMRSVGAVGARFLGLDATHFAQRSDVAAQPVLLPRA